MLGRAAGVILHLAASRKGEELKRKHDTILRGHVERMEWSATQSGRGPLTGASGQLRYCRVTPSSGAPPDDRARPYPVKHADRRDGLDRGQRRSHAAAAGGAP